MQHNSSSKKKDTDDLHEKKEKSIRSDCGIIADDVHYTFVHLIIKFNWLVKN